MIPKKMEIESKKTLLIVIIVLGVLLKFIVMVATQSWKFENDFVFAYESGEIGASLATGKSYSWLTAKEHNQSKANEPTA